MRRGPKACTKRLVIKVAVGWRRVSKKLVASWWAIYLPSEPADLGNLVAFVAGPEDCGRGVSMVQLDRFVQHSISDADSQTA
jgi:hypothetical protein